MSLKVKIDPDQLFEDLLIAPRFRPLRYICLFSIVLLLGINNFDVEFNDYGWLWSFLLTTLIFVPVFINVLVLVPRLLLKGRPYLYLFTISAIILSTLAVNTCVQYLNMDVFNSLYNPSEHGSIAKYIFLQNFSISISFSLIIAGSASVVILQSWLRDKRRITELEGTSAQAELDMLKNQINPHFLFNMLNNAIVLTGEDPAEARQVILKLREMLNYQLEKSDVEKILLREDINFLAGLLDLEKVRRDSFDFHISTVGDTEGIEVPPLLFIPFVENAIKHGNDNTGSSYISLEFRLEGGRLYFSCINSIPSHSPAHTAGGIGLKNIRRRLELIYGPDHTLDISRSPDTYVVNLNIAI